MPYPCAATDDGRLKIAWITDIHIDVDVPARTPKLESFVTSANAWGADCTIVSGDMIDDGGDDPNLTTYVAANILAGLNHPYYVVPGNHDLIPNDSNKNISFGPTWKAYTLAAYGYSTFEQAFDIGNARIIMCDTNYNAAGAYGWVTKANMPQAQIDWIDAELAATTQDFAIIVSHQPISDISQYTDYPTHEPDAGFLATMQAMLDSHAVPKIALCGHSHPAQLLRPQTPVPVGAPTGFVGNFGATSVYMFNNFFAEFKYAQMSLLSVGAWVDVDIKTVTV